MYRLKWTLLFTWEYFIGLQISYILEKPRAYFAQGEMYMIGFQMEEIAIYAWGK